MKSGIYGITNKDNGVVYIGQAENLNTRFNRHVYRLKRNEHHNKFMQNVFNKYGEDIFEYEVIEEVDLKLLNEQEKYWIDRHGGINSRDNYNLKDPLLNEHADYIKKEQSVKMTGENNPNYGNKWDDKQRDVMSKRLKGVSLEDRIGKDKAEVSKSKMSKSQKGRKHSQETKRKIGDAHRGEKSVFYGNGDRQRGDKNPNWGKPAHNRKSVLQFSKDGELIKEYACATDVLKDGFNVGNVCSCANGKKGYKSHKGFIWRWRDAGTY